MSLPTIAEVREALMDGESVVRLAHYGGVEERCAAAIDRLDPATQVIVDRNSLAAALVATSEVGASPEVGGWKWHEERADAILAALRGET